MARLERDLVARARPDPRVQALQALPGIGPITAMTLVVEIGDIARFPTARKLCAWAGLTPAVRNSDRKVRHGHITKMGSPWVRFVLQEAAQRAKTRPPFAAFYAKTAARRGTHIATVAVAASSLLAASTCSASSKPRPEKVNRRVRSPHHMCLRHGRRTD